MEKQRKIFLSYSRFSTDFAIRLVKELKAEGFNIWTRPAVLADR